MFISVCSNIVAKLVKSFEFLVINRFIFERSKKLFKREEGAAHFLMHNSQFTMQNWLCLLLLKRSAIFILNNDSAW